MSLPELAMTAVGLAGAGTLGVGAYGVFHPYASVFGPTVWRGPTDRLQVALTFDDGPHPHYTPRVLEVLSRSRLQATFFCIGQRLERESALGRELAAEGHQLANHTFTHDTGRDLFFADRLVEDLKRC